MTIESKTIMILTKYVLGKSLYDYFTKHNWKITNHIILDRLYPEERNITSRMSGLQTSLGTFWEKLARVMLQVEKCKIIDPKTIKEPIILPKRIEALKNEVKQTREQSGGSLQRLRNELDTISISSSDPSSIYQIPKGKGADLIFVKDGTTYICDTKTVQVNANNGNTFNETVIIWLCYYKIKTGLPSSRIKPCFVFPYNSSNELDDSSWWFDYKDRVKPLTKDEVLVGNEFWSLITGNPDALTYIIKGIESFIGTPEHLTYKKVFSLNTVESLSKFSDYVKKTVNIQDIF